MMAVIVGSSLGSLAARFILVSLRNGGYEVILGVFHSVNIRSWAGNWSYLARSVRVLDV